MTRNGCCEQVRDRKRKFDEFTHESHQDHEGLGEADLREHEELTKVKNVNKIQFGKYILDTWYFRSVSSVSRSCACAHMHGGVYGVVGLLVRRVPQTQADVDVD